ncbi:putative ribonuclease H-like domain-containing protein [Tanacetum coccineum]
MDCALSILSSMQLPINNGDNQGMMYLQAVVAVLRLQMDMVKEIRAAAKIAMAEGGLILNPTNSSLNEAEKTAVVTAVTTADAIGQMVKTTMQVTLMVTPALDTPIECLRTPSKQNLSLGRLGSNFNNLSKTNEVNIKKPKSVHESVVTKPKINRDKVIIEDWNSDDKDDVSEVNTVSPVKTNETQTVKTQVDKIGQISQKEGIGFKKIKACFVCKSTDHLIKDCDFYDKKSPEPTLKIVVNTGQRVVKLVWDNAKRVNHQKISNKLKYPQKRRTFVPSGVLTRTGLDNPARTNRKRAVDTVSTIRPVSTARSVSTARPVSTASLLSLLGPVSTARPGNPEYVYRIMPVWIVVALAMMTSNKAYLLDNMNLSLTFFLSHKCVTRKNSILFTDTECLILSPSFKLLDENQVVLRAPRHNGVYSLDLKNIVPSGGLENQLNHKVKIIRSDHGTEFKNHVINEFCAKKGIKREFSVARTPQQNGDAERKNRTLIEAARTMLADSLLPILFWAEAVNTACYVLNTILVITP